MMQLACLVPHLQWLLLLRGMSCAAVCHLQRGAESRLHSLGATALHQGLCAACDWGGALGIPVWRVAGKCVGRVGALLYYLSFLQP